jgi:glycosyltransferase involved in cell wall biosynthesis
VVVQLVERLAVGGAENLAVRIANGRAATGAPSFLYALKPDGPLTARVAREVTLRELNLERRSVRQFPAFLGSLRRGRQGLSRQLATDRVDVVQAHLPEANFWGLAVTGRRGPAVIATVHNNDEFHYGEGDGGIRRALRRQAYRLIVARCAAVVTVSAAVRDSLAAELRLSSAQADGLVVVPNGVTVHEPMPGARDEVRRELGLTPAQHLVLGAGRLTAQKNFADLVSVAAALRDRGAQAVVAIAGDGELRDALQRQASDLGLTSELRLLGIRDDLERLLQASDLFVLSSRWEGLPLVLLEAMAAGCPVVGYAIDGTRDVLEDGRHGVLVPPDDTDALAGAVAALLDQPERRRDLGQAGRRLVLERHDFSHVLTRLEALYAELTTARRELLGRP